MLKGFTWAYAWGLFSLPHQCLTMVLASLLLCLQGQHVLLLLRGHPQAQRQEGQLSLLLQAMQAGMQGTHAACGP